MKTHAPGLGHPGYLWDRHGGGCETAAVPWCHHGHTGPRKKNLGVLRLPIDSGWSIWGGEVVSQVCAAGGGTWGWAAVRRGRCALPHVPPQLIQVSP